MNVPLGVPREASGFAVLELLAAVGWSIAIYPGADGLVVRATRGEAIVAREAERVAEAALLVHAAATRRQGWRGV